MARRAVFLDRDKTIIADPGYINSPDQVKLLPEAAESVRSLNEAGYAVVVATNQSGVARGLLTEAQLAGIHERMREMLLEQGAQVDAVYYCPYLDGPEAVVERYRQQSTHRKPGPGMLIQAAEELGLILENSWMIGDSARDVLAGQGAGCRTVLINKGPVDGTGESCAPDYMAESLSEAVHIVLANRDVPRAASIPEAVAQPVADTSSTPQIGAMASALAEICEMLRRRERRERQEDFSVARLVATLAQMLAIVAGIWGLAAVFGDAILATPRLALAVFLQLVALTARVAGGRR